MEQRDVSKQRIKSEGWVCPGVKGDINKKGLFVIKKGDILLKEGGLKDNNYPFPLGL